LARAFRLLKPPPRCALAAPEASGQQPAPAPRSPWYVTLSMGALLAQEARYTTAA